MTTTLLEFAVVLVLKRKFENANGKSRVSALDFGTNNINQLYGIPTFDRNFEEQNGSNRDKKASNVNGPHTGISFNIIENGFCTKASPITRIDITMFWFFTLSYVTFNIFYWSVYLSI